MILDMLTSDSHVDRTRVCVDHVEEHTAKLVLDQGFWAGMTLYPVSKCAAPCSANRWRAWARTASLT